MNLKHIDFAINSYNSILDKEDKERLSFFRYLWEAMDVWSTGPTSAKQRYVYPDKDQIEAKWEEGTPLFRSFPVSVNKARFCTIFSSLRNYFLKTSQIEKEDADLLSNVELFDLIDDEDLQLAGKNPEEFLEIVSIRAKEPGIKTSLAGVVVLLVMLSLRVELEPIAKKLAEAFPYEKAEGVHPLRCPVCGSVPSLAKVGGDSPTEGRGRLLYCQQCGTAWSFERIRCARCGTRNQAHLHYFNIEGDDGHRIALCDECGGYIRSIFIEDALRPFSFEVEEVVTARLEAIARDPRFSSVEEKPQ